MKNTWILGAVVLFSVLITLLLVRGCKKEVIVSPTQVLKDSVDSWEVQAQRVVDSINKANNYLLKERDSLTKLTAKQSQQLEVKEVKIGALARQYEIYKKFHDSDNQIAICDSLIPQIDSLTDAVGNYRRSNRELLNRIDSVEDSHSLGDAQKEYFTSQLRSAFDTLSVAALSLEKQNRTLFKKSSKKWTVGPVGAYGVDKDLKRNFFIGVGVSYKIFSF